MVSVKEWLAKYWPFIAVIAVTGVSVVSIWWLALATRPIVPPYP